MGESLTAIVKSMFDAVILSIVTVGSVALMVILVLLPISAVMGWI